MSKNGVRLCKASDVNEGAAKQIQKPGSPDDYLAVIKLDGQFYLTDDMCTHAMASLCDGDIANGEIFCPLHGGSFDIKTGEAREFPCTEKLKTYEIYQEGDDLYGVMA